MSANVPATVWQDPDQDVEYTVGDANSIVDPSGNTLVDPDGNQVIDTGVTADFIPATVWSEDDGE